MSHGMFAARLPGRGTNGELVAELFQDIVRSSKKGAAKLSSVDDNKERTDDANRTPRVGALLETISKQPSREPVESWFSQTKSWLMALLEEEPEEDEDFEEHILDIHTDTGFLRVPFIRSDTIAELLPRAAALAAEHGFAPGLQVQVKPPPHADEILVGSAVADLPEGTVWVLTSSGAFETPDEASEDEEGSATFVDDPTLGPSVRITGAKGLEEFLVTWNF